MGFPLGRKMHSAALVANEEKFFAADTLKSIKPAVHVFRF